MGPSTFLDFLSGLADMVVGKSFSFDRSGSVLDDVVSNKEKIKSL